MAVTGISDLFSPEVIGDITTNLLYKDLSLLNSGVVVNSRPWMQNPNESGNTVTFLYFDTTQGVVQDNPGATRTGVTASKAHMSSYTEALRSKIISMDFDKNGLADTAGDVNGHVAEFVAEESGLDIQNFLITQARGTDLLYDALSDSTKTLNVDIIAAAKYKRGEKAIKGMPILFAHSNCIKDLSQSTDFKTLGSAATSAFVAALNPPPGAVGMVHGCWVVPLDSVQTTYGLTISGITRSSTTATATTTTAHGLLAGDRVIIASATESEYNGTITVVSVPTSTTFTYTVSGTPTTPSAGGAVFTPTYDNILGWQGSLGFMPKKAVSATVKDVHTGTTVFTVDFDFRYTGTLKRIKPRGIVVLRSK